MSGGSPTGGPFIDGPLLDGPVLAVDASARPVVALVGPAGEPWGVWEQEPGRRGTAELAVRAAALLEARGLGPADLAGVAVGIGPGSYTGLRAAIAFARGLTWSAGLPLAAVVSTEAAALAALRAYPSATDVTVVLDARRDECYRADYRRVAEAARADDAAADASTDAAAADADAPRAPTRVEETAPPRLVPSDEVAALEASTDSSRIVVREPHPDGYDVAALGRRRLSTGGDPPAAVLPLYLKRSHAEIALEERARRR